MSLQASAFPLTLGASTAMLPIVLLLTKPVVGHSKSYLNEGIVSLTLSSLHSGAWSHLLLMRDFSHMLSSASVVAHFCFFLLFFS